jgi:hypothetical protein
VKGIQFVQLKGQVLFKGGEYNKNVKMGWGHLKIFFSRTLMPRKAEFYMKASLHRTRASWLKSWPPRVGWGKWK